MQGSPHTGRERSAPTTSQQLSPPLRHSGRLKSAKMLCLMPPQYFSGEDADEVAATAFHQVQVR